ncbi:MAG: D-alanyl-D-alanine carboxypeptidase family protein [Leptolyngbyaceae cyanobacterium RU_5_1]|nr:D-alanyl-D-alanine carboxypeptidase family protein [Leptolyngbyaceae cyanobacterium RU_5_1]
MDKVSAPDNSANITHRLPDDIPVAVRETPDVAPKPKFRKLLLVGGLTAVGAIALAAGVLVATQFQRSQRSSAAQSVSQASPTPSPSASPTSNDTMLGHFRYEEAPQPDLAPIVADGSIKLRKVAARAYREMEDAARRDGVVLVPISGFRSLTDQDYLFFGKKAERGQVATERAKVSAPPGYSEHHTGYAIDIGDGNVPATNLSPSFENTAAYKWLKANAAFYSFELSFPKNNKQGVSYEPWHWRFVGDRKSLETFYKARGTK